MISDFGVGFRIHVFSDPSFWVPDSVSSAIVDDRFHVEIPDPMLKIQVLDSGFRIEILNSILEFWFPESEFHGFSDSTFWIACRNSRFSSFFDYNSSLDSAL